MKRIELLAPVGNQDNLEAAIHAGADAVYLAGSRFGARKSAKNFDKEGLIEAIRYSHLNGVAVYVTVNTLIKPNELEDMYQWIDFLYTHDVDAVIVQDLAVFEYVQKHYPDLACHASTQMTCHHIGDVLLAQEIGFKRVVLARELSLEEIMNIHEKTSVELEFFIHGALCVSYSGQCLMSSSIGGRSGNRGACAQPCRQAYSLKSKDTDQVLSNPDMPYILSPKDVNTMALIDALKSYERLSLKIEGRMKRVDYVYSVVSAYRQKLDDQAVQITSVERAFNRGYSEGHFGKSDFSQLMNYQSPSHQGTLLGKVVNYKDQTLELRLFDSIHKSDEIQVRRFKESVGTRADMIFKGGQRVTEASIGDVVKIPFKYPLKKNEMVYKTFDTAFVSEMNQLAKTFYPIYGLKAHFTMKIGQPAILELSDEKGLKCIIQSQRIVEEAINKPLEEDRVIAQLSKLGGTLFFLSETHIDLDHKAVVSISELNKMRRGGISFFEDHYSLWYPNRLDQESNLAANQSKENLLKNENIQTDYKQNIRPNKALYDYICNDIEFMKTHPLKEGDRYMMSDLRGYQKDMAWCLENDIIPILPKIIRESEWPRLDKWLEAYNHAGGKTLMIRQLGTLKHLKNNYRLIIDTPFNIMNGDSLEAYVKYINNLNYKCDTLYLSNEISLKDLSQISTVSGTSIGLAMFGHLELMTSEYCPVGGVLHGHDHCGECSKRDFYLEDNQFRKFPLSLDNIPCRMTLLSPSPISEFQHVKTCLQYGVGRYKIDLRHLQNKAWREDLYEKNFANVKSQQRSYLLEAIE